MRRKKKKKKKEEDPADIHCQSNDRRRTEANKREGEGKRQKIE